MTGICIGVVVADILSLVLYPRNASDVAVQSAQEVLTHVCSLHRVVWRGMLHPSLEEVNNAMRPLQRKVQRLQDELQVAAMEATTALKYVSGEQYGFSRGGWNFYGYALRSDNF